MSIASSALGFAAAALLAGIAHAQALRISPGIVLGAELVAAENIAVDRMARECGNESLYTDWRKRNTKFLEAGARFHTLLLAGIAQRRGTEEMLKAQRDIGADIRREAEETLKSWKSVADKPPCERFLEQSRNGKLDFSAESPYWPQLQELLSTIQ